MSTTKLLGRVVAILTVAVVGVFASSASVSAEDIKRYSAYTNCKGNGSENWGSIQNTSSSSQGYICALTKDATERLTQSIASASITVVDYHDNASISCTIYSVYWSGSSASAFSDTEATSQFGYSLNVTTLYFPALDGGDMYYAICGLPQQQGYPSGSPSKIVNLRVTEVDDE
jgi:hypothetical protein